MFGGAGSPCGDDLLTVTVLRDEHGYGMKVSGDNPVYVQSVKEHGAAWRAGLRAGDRILRVDNIPVQHHSHQQVVHLIRANPSTVLTVQQNTSRLKTPITAPVPANLEKQRQFEASKVKTMRQMLEKEQKHIRDVRNELLKVPDVRKAAELESAEQRCSKLQHEIDLILEGQTDNRTGVPVLHIRSRSSPEQLDHDLNNSMKCDNVVSGSATCGVSAEWGARDTPPPGTPPPPYHTNTQPCSDPQRAIISMEEDDSPASDNSSYSGLFSNLRSVRESKARTAVLLNWLLGERRCACACLLLVLTDGWQMARATSATLRRWAYELHSTFLMPRARLHVPQADEHLANEIEHVLVNEYEKEELLRSVFRKARQRAKEELAAQLAEFQVKRQLGLAALYQPDDAVIDRCDVDKTQEQAVVEQLLCAQLRQVAAGGVTGCAAGGPGGQGAQGAGGDKDQEANNLLLAALAAAALCLHCRPASVAAAVGGQRATFLQRDKFYKQRVKQITKQNPQPFVVRGHHLSVCALTSLAHCHHCDHVIAGLAPQAYVCNDCKLRVHRGCARHVEEGCCLDGDHNTNRISRFMERIHAPNAGQDSAEKKARKASGTAHFLNMERSFRKTEDDPPIEPAVTSSPIERRDESDESLYESADGQSDAISASDDALPRLGKTPTISKESLKLAVTDEEAEMKFKKGHRKAVSLSNPLEMVKNLGDEWFESAKKELEKNCDKKKSRESLWSEEDRDSIHGSTNFLDQIRKNSRKEDKSQSNSRKSSTNEPPKTRKISKGSSISSLNFLRRKKTPTSTKPVEVVAEDSSKTFSIEEILNYTKLFLEGEKRHSSIEVKPPIETDSEDEPPTPKQLAGHRRRLSRQTSRSKSKARGKSQSLKVNTLRKSHSGTLKKPKKKTVKTPTIGRSRQTSLVESPIIKKKNSDVGKQNSWLFSGYRGEAKREGSNDEPTAPEVDIDTNDANHKEQEKENSVRAALSSRGTGVNRAESCRERDAPRRGKHRNASDPNRLTPHNNHDLEPGAATAPSGSSSSSSLSSRSNESNTVAAEQHASQSDVSDEEEPLPAQWADGVPPHVMATLTLSARLRKRQEVIHELIVSESSHVRWLKVLGRVFLRPLEAATGLLPQEDLRALFPNLPAVRERHARLLRELRALRAPHAHTVPAGPVADALLNTLGDSGYAACLARFCGGQRLALERLRERRRKHKELHCWLQQREQQPLCARLQLRDLLAVVWQRLTKYQLLLESIIKTMCPEEGDSEDELARLQHALVVAKDVLHTVDTAIRTTENEHRLRSIQSKLEVRGGAEWEELRRLDLPTRTLTHEGDLAIRHDAHKKTHVLALMLEDCLVLFHREGDKFVLKPIPQPSQQQLLSPVIQWDKVLFRPNAAVRNTFFLMNINGVQMHELTANSASDYNTWVKHIQEAPLAKLTELKPNITPSHHATRSTDDSGINVSRNPSDASEKSNSTVEEECERDRVSVERSSSERERDNNIDERSDVNTPDKEDEKEESHDKTEKTHKPRRPTVGRISTHCESPAPLLPAVTPIEPAHTVATAELALSTQERLRRLDSIIGRCLSRKSSLVCSSLGVPLDHRATVTEMAVADTLGQLEGGSLPKSGSHTSAGQLVLAAWAQAEQLTRIISGALQLQPADLVLARAGRCDACAAAPPRPPRPMENTDITCDIKSSDLSDSALEEMSYDTLAELDVAPDCEADEPHLEYYGSGGAALAARLSGAALGLQATLSALVATSPHHADVATLREQNDMLRARLRRYENETNEDLTFPKTGVDTIIQEQPSNGG